LTLALGGGAFFLFFFVTGWPIMRVIIGTAIGSVLGYYLPMLQIQGKIRKRQDAVIKALPDALDLMVICVEAGLSFDGAMGRVYEKWDNELAIIFGRVIQEIQLGRTRRDSLRDMSRKIDVPDFSNFAAAIIQADQLGVSIGKILRIQSDQMRIKRRQRAQEKAHQAPVKMMIPMTFFIFPSIWIVLLGPSVITVMKLNVF
jgi:tight adherence protein C